MDKEAPEGDGLPMPFPPELRHHVIHLAKTRYPDFNFSHLSEILAEDQGIHINRREPEAVASAPGTGMRVRKWSPIAPGAGAVPGKARCYLLTAPISGSVRRAPP